MEESTAHTPQPNEFEISDDEAYAMVDIRLWEVAEFLMTKLEPVNLENLDLDSDDCICPICQANFRVSENVKLSHIPVKLACGHIFARKCIIRWFDPLCAYGLLEDRDIEENDMDDDLDRIPMVKTSCPMCRVEFFPECKTEALEVLANRLQFWDIAYACAGVARSEKEERSRKCLWQYVEYCRSMDEINLEGHWELKLQKAAQKELWYFATLLKLQYRVLTPVQENLRKKLERISRKDLDKCAFENGMWDFNIDRDDNERIGFQGVPLG